jgi:hypothetical protein
LPIDVHTVKNGRTAVHSTPMAFANARIAVQKALGSSSGVDSVRIRWRITSIAGARSSDVM